MKTLIPFYLLAYVALVLFVETCSRPVDLTPAEPDSLALQHRLAHSLDSIDSLYPAGCYWDGHEHVCPDPAPPRAP